MSAQNDEQQQQQQQPGVYPRAMSNDTKHKTEAKLHHAVTAYGTDF